MKMLKTSMTAGLVFSLLAAGALLAPSFAHDDHVDRILDRDHDAYHRRLEQQRRVLNNQHRYGYANDSVFDRLGRVLTGGTYDPYNNRYNSRYNNYGRYTRVGWNPPGPPPHAAVWRKHEAKHQKWHNKNDRRYDRDHRRWHRDHDD